MTRAWKIFVAWIWEMLRSITNMANAMIPPLDGRLGYADESLSARAFRARRDGKKWTAWTATFIDWLFRTIAKQPDHCAKAYAQEEWRRRNPPETREV